MHRKLEYPIRVVNNEWDRLRAIKIKKKMFLLKFVFEKAFDSINWKYLGSMMEKIRFCGKWISWIYSCLISYGSSVLVNNSPTKEFPITRGVCECDPLLSPFFFIITMKGLNVALPSSCIKSLFYGINVEYIGLTVSSLPYIEDDVFLGEWENDTFSEIFLYSRIFSSFIRSKSQFS